MPLNTRYTASEVEDILGRVRARALIAADRFADEDKVGAIERAGLPSLRHVIRISPDLDDGGEGWIALLSTGWIGTCPADPVFTQSAHSPLRPYRARPVLVPPTGVGETDINPETGEEFIRNAPSGG